MKKCIAYGTEDGINYYVQTCCDQEHKGQECECKSYGENFTQEEAEKLARKLGLELKLDVERW